jgi:hypothetical protein
MKELVDYLEIEMTIEDFKAVMVSLLENTFDGDKARTMEFLKKYKENKNAEYGPSSLATNRLFKR